MSILVKLLLAFLALLAKIVIAIAFPVIIWSFVRLCQNIQIARRSGLQYVVLPFHTYNFRWAMIIGRPFLQRFNRYASADPPITSWRRLAESLWPLKLRHAPFVELGTDTFLTVSPGGIIVNTADADVIENIIGRPYDFPKAILLYKAIAIYGQNVVSAGGGMWKRHRKLTSHAFSERNNRLVWKTTLARSLVMLASWTQSGNFKRSIQQLRSDAMELSLEVIGRAGLGQNIKWADENSDVADKTVSSGHSMTFAVSLRYVCEHILSIVQLVRSPTWLQKYRTREKINQKHLDAFSDWGLHMKEMLAAKKKSLASNDIQSSTVDIIGQLLKGQDEQIDKDYEQPLSDEEVMGNLFLFTIAGQDTSASSIFLSILLLALHPMAQQEVQQELDDIFQGRSASDWDYEQHLPRLLNGKVGAVLNEQLRLQSPTLTIPKLVTSTPQQIMVDGKQVTLPADAIIRICQLAVHINPKFWPHGPPKDASRPTFDYNNLNNDLGEFKPERWSTPSSPNGYKPHPGAFLPFSSGQRVCLGKRFAQVEIVTALAIIFSQYSIELDISAMVSDSELGNMTKEGRYKVWKEAEEKAQREWRTKVTCLITVQLTKNANIPLRLVKRGEEKFFDFE